LICAEARI